MVMPQQDFGLKFVDFEEVLVQGQNFSSNKTDI